MCQSYEYVSNVFDKCRIVLFTKAFYNSSFFFYLWRAEFPLTYIRKVAQYRTKSGQYKRQL